MKMTKLVGRTFLAILSREHSFTLKGEISLYDWPLFGRF